MYLVVLYSTVPLSDEVELGGGGSGGGGSGGGVWSTYHFRLCWCVACARSSIIERVRNVINQAQAFLLNQAIRMHLKR